MFILFGTRDRAVEIDSGQFHCPNCNVKKEYGKKYVQESSSSEFYRSVT